MKCGYDFCKRKSTHYYMEEIPYRIHRPVCMKCRKELIDNYDYDKYDFDRIEVEK